jgi:hypothetical protein
VAIPARKTEWYTDIGSAKGRSAVSTGPALTAPLFLAVKYGSLDELRDGGNIIPNRPNYSYSAQTTETTFTIIAAYSGTDASAPKRLTTDHNMSMTTD